MKTITTALFLIFFLKLKSSWSCNPEFDLAAEARYRDENEKISQDLYCACDSDHCDFQIGYEYTKTWSHTVEGNVGVNIFSFFSASGGYSHEWGTSAATSSSVVCSAKPGRKVWVSIVPKMMKRLGWLRRKCKNEEAWLEMKVPLKTKSGTLDAEIWCNSEQFSTCIENPNGTCHGINEYKDIHDEYCRTNCGLGFCPPDKCAC